MPRFIAFDFIIENPCIIDCEKKTMTFYSTNYQGDLLVHNGKETTITTARINGLIKRINSGAYRDIRKRYAVDPWIYYALMTPAQQAECRYTPDINLKEIISTGDDYAEILLDCMEYVKPSSTDKYASKEAQTA